MVITARRAADSCREWYFAFRNKGKGEEKCVLELLDAADTIKALEAALPKWISVEDRLPEDDLPKSSEVKVIKVFVAIKAKNGITIRTQLRHRRTLFDTRGEPFFDWEWRHSAGNVTHWMPLPKPPKEIHANEEHSE